MRRSDGLDKASRLGPAGKQVRLVGRFRGMSQSGGLQAPASGPYQTGLAPRQPSPRSVRRVLIVRVAVTALGFGFWTWLIFLMLGIRARRRAWILWSAGYGVLAVAGAVLEALPDPSGTAAGIAVIPILLGWIGGVVHVALISKDATRRIWALSAPSLVAARERIERRAEGRRLAARNPVLARELGVGRPDVPGADDYGLVDVNHAAPDALCRLPGITPQVAARIEETRLGISPFMSAEDLCVTLDLPPALTGDLKEHAIFL